MENVLFVAHESVEVIEDNLDSQAFPAVLESHQYFIFVPELVGGKMVSWLVSDPDDEEPKFNKDFMLAFGFKDKAHALRARDAVILEGYDCHLFGDLYE